MQQSSSYLKMPKETFHITEKVITINSNYSNMKQGDKLDIQLFFNIFAKTYSFAESDIQIRGFELRQI